MKKIFLVLFVISLFGCVSVSFNQPNPGNRYNVTRY